MRLKKGFTLAEILIVLVTIGVIATMTIPSMMKGVTETQYKTGYKKAYNTIANFAALEKVAGNLPAVRDAAGANKTSLYKSLNNALSVKTFAIQDIGAGSTLTNPQAYSSCIQSTITAGTGETATKEVTTIGVKDDQNTTCLSINDNQVWIITEDNIAYTVQDGGIDEGTQCATKQAIAAKADDEKATDASCYIVMVDVDGLNKGQNIVEPQGIITKEGTGENATTSGSPLETTAAMDTLTGDQYKIYIGSDGASAGPRLTTVTGRITSDIK